MPTLQLETLIPPQDVEAMVRYYEESGPDYQTWSPGFNMHFGYWEAWMNPLRREALLERMNRKVTATMEGLRNVLDMGCGVGATARSLAARSNWTNVTGVTIVPWQIERAREMTPAQTPIRFCQADYTRTPFANGTFDGVYAIESFCHAAGRAKAECLREAHRVLRKGGEIVIADGFLRRNEPLSGILASCHRRICQCWSMDTLPVLPAVLCGLRDTGFQISEVEEISWRVAPSVAHVPFVTVRFLLRELITKRNKLSRERWNNLLAPLLTGVVGLARSHFGYYIVRAHKR